MLLHNQTCRPLTWDAAGKSYSWEPYGAAEVPEHLFEHARAQKLPVGIAPISPEAKATATRDAAASAARKDEVNVLKRELSLAQAAKDTAEQTAEQREILLEKAQDQLAEAEERLKAETDRADRADADKKAAEELLAEATSKLEALQSAIPRQGQRKQQKQDSGGS